MTTTAAVAEKKFSKEQLARKWASLKGQLQKAQEVGTEMASRTFSGMAGLGTFSLAYYYRRRRQLAGKRVTFDKGKDGALNGRADAFFWTGLGIAALGITPLAGDAGRHVVSAGIGMASAGSVDFLDKLAEDHHKKA